MKRKNHAKYPYHEPARTEILEVQRQLLHLNDLASILKHEYTADAYKLYNQIGVYSIRLKAWLIFREIILGIGRLIDPPSTMGHKNINFRTLAATLKDTNASFVHLAKRIDECLASDDIKIVRTHRNKSVAHSDYETLINKGELPPLGYPAINKSLENFTKLLDLISFEVLGGEIMYSNEDQISREADEFFAVLEQGLLHKAVKQRTPE